MDSFWSGLIGAVVGAVAGSVVSGVITWRLQLSAASADKSQRDEDAQSRQKALGHAIQLKVIRITSNLKLENASIQDAVAYQAAHPSNPWVWPFLRPQANEFARVDFTTDELAFLMGAKETDLFNTVCDLDSIHNDLLGLIRVFSNARSELDRKVPHRKTGTGYEVVMDSNQYAAVELEIDSVEKLARYLAERCPVDLAQASEAFRLVNDMMTRRFGTTLNFSNREPTHFKNG